MVGSNLLDELYTVVSFLVAKGVPTNLSSSAIAGPGVVSLSWSPPVVSADRTDAVQFEYEVKLTNESILKFNTTDTRVTLSRLNITDDNDKCTEYSWSVAAAVSDRQTDHIQGNGSIILQTGNFCVLLNALSYDMVITAMILLYRACVEWKCLLSDNGVLRWTEYHCSVFCEWVV